MIFLTLLIILPSHAAINQLFFSQQLKLGDNFVWVDSKTQTFSGTGLPTKTTTYTFDVTITKDIAGVEMTPVTFYDEYFDFKFNGTSYTNFNEYFYTKVSDFGHPLISPITYANDTSYFNNLRKLHWLDDINATISHNSANLTIEISNQRIPFGFALQIANYTLTYDLNSGVLLHYYSNLTYPSPSGNNTKIISISLQSGPDYIGQTSSSASSKFPFPDVFLPFVVLIPISMVVLRKKDNIGK